ncbi:MAG: DUF4416 family protein [Spirochaetales bacterium]|nr:DUF4416 family protein [Spirochaetales bacterium]
MGDITSFTPEKLIIAVLISKREMLDKLINILKDNFGPVDFKSELLEFTYTDYYNLEMGNKIERFFLSFHNLIDPENLPDIKILTNEIENSFLLDNQRKVNLDPGMLSVKRFILATSKDNGHRVPMQKGIYGEVTLLFINKNFQALPWTYIDYRSEEYSKILKEIRIIYKKNLKELKQK